MEALEREYRYRLFSTPNVTCGPEVADFITATSGGIIRIEPVGEVSFTPELASPIYKEQAKFHFDSEFLGEGQNVVLVHADLAEPVYWYEGYAVLSRHGLKIGRVAGPDVPIYAYLTLIAITRQELSSSDPAGFMEALVSAPGPFGWEALINSGKLPGDLREMLEAAGERIGLEFTRAVDQVLAAIAKGSSEVRAVPSSEPDPRKNPPREVKAGLGMGVSLKATESAEEPRVTEAAGMVIEITDYFEELGAKLEEADKEVLAGIIESELPMRSEEDGLYLLMHSIRSEEFGVISNLQFFLESSGHPVSKELLASLPFKQLNDLEDGYVLKKAIERTDEGEREKGGASGGRKKVDSPPSPETASTGRFGFDSDSEAPIDALDYQGYAKALASTICDSATGMPFTLGICAPWGRGKTALMRFVKDEIEAINDTVKRSWNPKDLHQKRATVIDFNAWQFSRAEQVWSGFITTIMRKLEGGLYGFEEKLRLAWKLNKSRDLPVIYNLIAFVASVTVLATLAIAFAPNDWLAPLGLVGVGSLAFYRKVFTGAFKLATSPAAERISQLSKLPDYASRLDPIHKMLGNIKTITEEYKKGYLTGTVDRFVVFIDDIDRCEPDKIMETLEAIKHLLDLQHFVFVIAMDTRVVRHAIGKHYDFMCKTAKDREEMGRFYLEKMIQVPFHLPALTAEKRRQLGDSIIIKYLEEEPEPKAAPVMVDRVTEAVEKKREAAPSLAREAVYTAEPLTSEGSPTPAAPAEAEPDPSTLSDEPKLPGPIEDVRLRITPSEYRIIDEIMNTDGFEISPRLIKRFINVYMMARHILIMELAGKSGTGSGFVPHPSFIKWLAVSVLHPFEASALIKWLADNSWADPLDNTLSVFEDSGRFCYKERPNDPPPGGRAREEQAPFTHLKLQELHRIGFILSQWDMNWDEVRKTLHITNLFNLVLE